MGRGTLKYIAIGVGLISLTAAGALYFQYNRLMQYVIGLKAIRLVSFNSNSFIIDILLGLENKSDISFDIESQEYSAYINNKLIAKVGNTKKVPVKPGANQIAVRVNVNPQKVFNDVRGLQGMLDMIATPELVQIKIVIKLFVRLWFLKFSIPYTYQSTLKELLAKK